MRMLGLALAGVLSVMATPVAAATLFVFGDSLVDTGNADAALRARGQPTRSPPHPAISRTASRTAILSPTSCR